MKEVGAALWPVKHEKSGSQWDPMPSGIMICFYEKVCKRICNGFLRLFFKVKVCGIRVQ